MCLFCLHCQHKQFCKPAGWLPGGQTEVCTIEELADKHTSPITYTMAYVFHSLLFKIQYHKNA